MLVGVSLKIALGMFYLRIAIERWHIRVIKFIVIATAIFGFACLFLVVFQCVPGTHIPHLIIHGRIYGRELNHAQCLPSG